MSELSDLGPGSDDLHNRARARDEELRRRIDQGGIPVDHGIREEITPEQREEWAERTRRHIDEEDKIIEKMREKMRGRTPPTTKSFSGLLKSLRAKYGLQKSLVSDEGEEWEDDEDRSGDSWSYSPEPGNSSKILDEEASKLFEKSYSSQVPIPHGNLSKTNIPPVEWEPGVGAKTLSELASFFKDMSDEKAYGQVHREKALELLQKAAPYHLLHQREEKETPSINRVYYEMSEGEPAFDPNPAGLPKPEYTPTQEEIWAQVVAEAAAQGRTPAFHPTEDENIPYAEPYRGEPAFDPMGRKAYDSQAEDYLNRLVALHQQQAEANNRFAQTNDEHVGMQWENRRQGRMGDVDPENPKWEQETGDKRERAWEDANQTADLRDQLEREVHEQYEPSGEYDSGRELTADAKRRSYGGEGKALSVLNSFLKNFAPGDSVLLVDPYFSGTDNHPHARGTAESLDYSERVFGPLTLDHPADSEYPNTEKPWRVREIDFPVREQDITKRPTEVSNS